MIALSPRVNDAHQAPDRWERVQDMADVMRDMEAADGACRTEHLRARGFTIHEIFAYSDDARAILSGRLDAGARAAAPGRAEGERLVKRARQVRRRIARRQGRG